MKRFWPLALILLALPGCGDDSMGFGEPDLEIVPPSAAVTAFVAAENFEPHQYTSQLLDWDGIEFFYTAYGPPQDCPSGCFYDLAYGLSYGGQIGWIRYDDQIHHAFSPDRDFDFQESDERLFDHDTWFALAYWDCWSCYDHLILALAGDEHTSRAALLTLSTLLLTNENRELALVLVENPAIAQDAEILGILVQLPSEPVDRFAEVRARAQELLDALED